MNKNVIRGAVGIVAIGAIGLTTGTAIGSSEAAPREVTFAPPNDFDLDDNLFAVTGITKDQFDGVINQLKSIYTPIISSHGGRLVVNALWDNGTVNASASQSGTTWTVNMYGGLARRAEVTSEGFAIVMCHELGHHLGGYTYTSADTWAASDGQSDWYATQACARRLWKDDAAGNAAFRTSAPQALRTKCDEAWTTTADQDLCYRVGSGGISAGTLLGNLGNVRVDISTPDTRVVTSTNLGYPGQQCRLDTYVTGALCTVQADLSVIPGKNNPRPKNSAASEREAALTRCLPASAGLGVPGYNGKDVPRCWFKPIVAAFSE